MQPYREREREGRRGEQQGCHISDTAFLRGVFFDPEDGGNIFLRNFG
jgi:hypothetical protein